MKVSCSCNPGQKSLENTRKLKGPYFLLRYIYITKNFGIAVLTVFKVTPPSKTILTTKAPIKDVEINIVRGEREERAA